MSIDMSYSEDRERLEKDRIELQMFLEDVDLILHINKYTDEEAYISKYIFSYKYLNKEDLDSRITELKNIFYMVKNNK